MLIYSGRNIFSERIVIRIQKRSLIAKYCNYCGERETMEKVDDVQADKRGGLLTSRIIEQFEAKKGLKEMELK